MLKFKVPEFIADMMKIFTHLAGCARPDCWTVQECHPDRQRLFVPFVNDLDGLPATTSSLTATIPGRITSAPFTTYGIAPHSTVIIRSGNRHQPPLLTWERPSRRIFHQQRFFIDHVERGHPRWSPGSRLCRHGRPAADGPIWSASRSSKSSAWLSGWNVVFLR